MKLIIPMAGNGTRLRPHTITTPKALVELAGKPMLAHVLDRLKSLKFSEVILIVNEENERLKKYIEKNYGYKVSFRVQTERKGDGHAVYQARDAFEDEPVFIMFADTLMEANFNKLDKKSDGVIYTKEVENPRAFGVVFEHEGHITKIIEKPETPESNKAIVGTYYFKSSKKLFESLDFVIKNNITSKGEYKMADAIQVLIDQGSLFKTAPVSVWKDCGTMESLLDANKYLLKGMDIKTKPKTSVIIKPVSIQPGVEIKNSIIGPNVSVGRDTIIENSILQDSIIGSDSEINGVVLTDSIIGKNARVTSKHKNLNVGDYSWTNH